AYDAQGGMVAARLWWLLRWLGHLPVAVLDGGWNQWIAEGRLQSPEVPPSQSANFSGKPGNIWVRANLVRLHLGDPGTVLVDARAPDRFRGQNETLDPVGGRIPGARNRYFRDNLDASGLFKAPETLREEFGAVLGPTGAENVVNY